MFLLVTAVRKLRKQQSYESYGMLDLWKLSALSFMVLHWIIVFVLFAAGSQGAKLLSK